MWLKESIFQPSNALRHSAELLSLTRDDCPPFAMAFTDGGPDHNIRHWNVVLAWLAYFLASGHDILVVARTAPTQSWTNPAERVMSPINLALQNCALARAQSTPEFEEVMGRCNSMAAVRKAYSGLLSGLPTNATHGEAATENETARNSDELQSNHDSESDGDESTSAEETESEDDASVDTDHVSSPIVDGASSDCPDDDILAGLRALHQADNEQVEMLRDASEHEDIMNSNEPWVAEVLADVDTIVAESEPEESPPDQAAAFMQAYKCSVQPVLTLVENLVDRAVWSGNHITTHTPASADDITRIFEILQAISPQLEQLNVTAGTISKYPELRKVISNHSRGSAYMRQFFKRPLVADCDCVACAKGLFKPLMMPMPEYMRLSTDYALPLPIPVAADSQSSELHYMPFEEAVGQPFTDQHQPSAKRSAQSTHNMRRSNGVVNATRELAVADGTKLALLQARCVRGVVHCRDCMKPRCLYSKRALHLMTPEGDPTAAQTQACREFALQKLAEAESNDLYICGMQPLDADDAFSTVLFARESLECYDPVEFEYYAQKKQSASDKFLSNLCCYCAGTSVGEDGQPCEGIVDESDLIEWKSVLPVCRLCRLQGALPVARCKRRNGSATADANARKASRQENQQEQQPVDGAAATVTTSRRRRRAPTQSAEPVRRGRSASRRRRG